MRGVCIIPARGGSKRVPRKNIKPFLNSTLLDLTIQGVIDSNVFSKIIVTSEDEEIIARAKEYPEVTIHNRSLELSSDTATVFSVFHNIIESLDEEFDFVAGVLVTTPFKTATHYKEAVEVFEKNNSEKNVISVTKFDYPPQFGFGLEDNELKMVYPEVFAKTTNSKFMESWYHNNGAIWISSIEKYLINKTFYKGDLVPYEMTAIESYDIDYPYQFEIAELLAKKFETKQK
jgi:pseudaminic acid cytidylyltransferase